jgi:hypothetical protein
MSEQLSGSGASSLQLRQASINAVLKTFFIIWLFAKIFQL